MSTPDDEIEKKTPFLEIGEPSELPSAKEGLLHDIGETSMTPEQHLERPLFPERPPRLSERIQAIVQRTPKPLLIVMGLSMMGALLVLPRFLVIISAILFEIFILLRILWIPLLAIGLTFYILNWYYYRR